MASNTTSNNTASNLEHGSGLRLNAVRTWRRLSIRVKLLIPALVALALTMVILIWRVPPPVNALVEGNVHGIFTTRLGELRTPLTRFLDDAQKNLAELSDSTELSSFLLVQGGTDKDAQSEAQSALGSVFVGKITDGELPYDQIRFVGVDGKQLTRASARLIGDAISGAIVPASSLTTEPIPSYFEDIYKLPAGQAYVLPARLSTPDKNSGLDAEPLIELAIPVFYRSAPAGMIISSFRARSLLVNTFRQSDKNVTYQSSLVDQNGRVVAMTDAAAPDGVALLGDESTKRLQESLPVAQLDSKSSNLQPLNGRMFAAAALSNQVGLPQNNWLLIADDDLNTVYAGARDLEITLIVSLAIVFVVMIGGIGFVSQSVIRPLIEVSRVADRVTAGDLEANAPLMSEDEVGMVARALNTMSSRLSELIRTLEARVQERTRNIEIAAEISRDTTQLSSLEALLQRTVDAIQQRFNLYHTQIFLADQDNKYAVLIVGSGAITDKLLAQEHKLEIGSSSIVGQTMANGKHFSILDTQNSEVPHKFNPLLPLTRSEIAMPLRIGDQVIGVLDLQSIEVSAFDDEDIEVFQMMGDQIAIAVNNARLFENSEEARKIADQANRQKSEFLSNMSHELRTPLNVIIGYSHSMLHRPTMYDNILLPSAYSSAVNSIMVSGQHLLGLINDILDLSKIEAGRIELDIRPTNVWSVLEGVRTTTIGLVKPGVKLRADYLNNLPPVMADELRFRQIVLNLVSNAAKFTEQGFITLDARVHEDEVLFSVADTGIGIPDEAKTLIFGRYRQAGRSVGGTGLGLNICQQLTAMHGGKIWFESTSGQGTTFYFTIPLAPDAAVAARPMIDVQGRVADASSAQIFSDDAETAEPLRQILVIDSGSDTRAALENVLTEAHYNVLSTDNHERALNIATMLVPDVVLIHLHAEDAEQMKNLAWLLHKDESLAQTEIVVIDERRLDILATEGQPALTQLALQMIQAKLPA